MGVVELRTPNRKVGPGFDLHSMLCPCRHMNFPSIALYPGFGGSTPHDIKLTGTLNLNANKQISSILH